MTSGARFTYKNVIGLKYSPDRENLNPLDCNRRGARRQTVFENNRTRRQRSGPTGVRIVRPFPGGCLRSHPGPTPHSPCPFFLMPECERLPHRRAGRRLPGLLPIRRGRRRRDRRSGGDRVAGVEAMPADAVRPAAEATRLTEGGQDDHDPEAAQPHQDLSLNPGTRGSTRIHGDPTRKAICPNRVPGVQPSCRVASAERGAGPSAELPGRSAGRDRIASARGAGRFVGPPGAVVTTTLAGNLSPKLLLPPDGILG
jgi:hypothetical protein